MCLLFLLEICVFLIKKLCMAMLEDLNKKAPILHYVRIFGPSVYSCSFQGATNWEKKSDFFSFRIKSGLRPLISEVTAHKEELESVQVSFILIQRNIEEVTHKIVAVLQRFP